MAEKMITAITHVVVAINAKSYFYRKSEYDGDSGYNISFTASMNSE